jgi:hypothetical protein
VRRAFVQVLYRVCGRAEGTFRVSTADGDIVIDRRERLPVLDLERAADLDGPFALDPQLAGDAGAAYLALWTYAPSCEDALQQLPKTLRPQLAIATPAGVAMVWVTESPYTAAPGTGNPDAAALLAAVADALHTIPPGPGDGIPLPRVDADLLSATTDTYADPGALWAWARTVLAEREREQTRALKAGATARAVEPDAGTAAGAADEAPDTGEAIAEHDGHPLGDDVRVAVPDPWSADEEAAAQPEDEPAPPRPAAPVPVAPVSAAAARPRPAAHPALDATPSLDPEMLRLLRALAEHMELSPGAALSRALVAHAMATLGTAEAYRLLGVRLTWARPDGLYGLAGDEWRKLA